MINLHVDNIIKIILLIEIILTHLIEYISRYNFFHYCTALVYNTIYNYIIMMCIVKQFGD